MNILVTGATGFVGRHLIPVLLRNKHKVTIVGRDVNKMHRVFKEALICVSWDELNTLNPAEFDAVINLAGENIAAQRWSSDVKQQIKDSRIKATTQIVDWCLQATQKKPHLYNTSAVGIYGLQAATDPFPKAYTEETAIHFGQPTDFLSEVAQGWEMAALSAAATDFPVTFMRFGVVLKRHEAMLKKLDLSFSLGLGSILGSGLQAISWIHIDDLVGAILFLITHPDIVGPVNLSAPQCVSQLQFAKTLADVMHRPLFLKMPAWLVTGLFGEMGKELLLGGQCVAPDRLQQAGFRFLYPDIYSALSHEWH